MRITTEQLKAVLGSNEILKGIDFQAQDNEFVGIIGPNGSGKSTLLRCLYRVLEPTQGAVYLDGKALSSYRYQESAKRISVVAQHNYYNFDFTVREVVMMGRAPHKKALDRDNADDYRIVRESLRKVGMQDFEDRSFSTLSGGEQQRIILARALAQQTPCLILDEPTNHLDMESITALNNGLIKFPGVMVFTSQDHQFVQTIANRIMELTPSGLIDKQCTYDEYLDSDEMARKRQIMNMDEQIADEDEAED